MTIRPRRSVLFMPGNNARAIEKARTLPADGVILDLEDAVAPDAKAGAREQIIKALQAGGFGRREVMIRTNGIDTPWFADDIEAAIKASPDAIVVPKVSTPHQVEMIGQRLLDKHAGAKIHLWIMIETALGVFNAPQLAATARDSETRLTGIIMGTNDLAKETRARIVPGRMPMLGWLSDCVLAAHAYGIDILDSVYNDIANTEGFAQECAQGRDLGFDGKTLIHPSQIEPCNAAYSPDPNEVAQARKLIAAFTLPENRDKGVIQINGKMVEKMHAEMAARTVAIADAIEGKG
jgi:citrate lyase subunit beta/citryl-CoA lyase